MKKKKDRRVRHRKDYRHAYYIKHLQEEKQQSRQWQIDHPEEAARMKRESRKRHGARWDRDAKIRRQLKKQNGN